MPRGVDPEGKLVWIPVVIVIAAVLSSPNIANAPAPGDETFPDTGPIGSEPQNIAIGTVIALTAPAGIGAIGAEVLDTVVENTTGIPVIVSPADLVESGIKKCTKRVTARINPPPKTKWQHGTDSRSGADMQTNGLDQDRFFGSKPVEEFDATGSSVTDNTCLLYTSPSPRDS